MISAGELDQQVQLLRPTVADDSMGQDVETFAVASTEWAKVTPLRGRTLLEAQQISSTASVRFRIRFREAFTGRWRVRWRGKDYRVVGEPADVDGRRVLLDFLAEAWGPAS